MLYLPSTTLLDFVPSGAYDSTCWSFFIYRGHADGFRNLPSFEGMFMTWTDSRYCMSLCRQTEIKPRKEECKCGREGFKYIKECFENGFFHWRLYSSLFLQHQQQQQLLQLSWQPSQQIQLQAAQINLIQHQQQHILQQHQQRLHTSTTKISITTATITEISAADLQVGPPAKSPVYEPGMCARRSMRYVFHQQRWPEERTYSDMQMICCRPLSIEYACRA